MKKKQYIRDGRSPIPENEITSRVMSANKAKDTKPEILLRKALCKSGYSGYRLHWINAPGRPDICYPGKRIAIFVNGCFWHRCPNCNPPMPKSNSVFWKEKFRKNKERDLSKTKKLKEDGWKVLTCWECEILKDVQKCVSKISYLLNN
jgi:DNA mismatch endonuclease, patch repair protein